MENKGGASEWAVERFGPQYASDVHRLVPVAIAAGISRQIDTHLASGLTSRHAFGGAWPALYEELENYIGALDSTEVVRPKGSQVNYVVVNGSLLVPRRYAADLTTSLNDRRVSQELNKICRDLLTQLGPEPKPVNEQLPLSEDFLPESDTAASAPRRLFDEFGPANMTLIPFAANDQSGLLTIGWGEAALTPDGILQWIHWESLQLPTAASATERGAAGLGGPRGSVVQRGPAGRFDDAPLDDPALSPKTATEQNTIEPVIEEPPPSQEAGDGGNDDGP